MVTPVTKWFARGPRTMGTSVTSTGPVPRETVMGPTRPLNSILSAPAAALINRT
jgi:hypothetical protein